MGLKRPFDAEEMQECNAKHARQLSYSHKQLTQLDEAIPFHVLEDLSGLSEKPTLTTNDDVEKGFDWIQTGSCQKDTQCEVTIPSALSHQSSGSDFTWRPLFPVEDVYSCLMNHPPRKQVSVGSNHQADIPECVKDKIQSCTSDDESERKLMGKCTIPMPDSDNDSGTGQGRKECFCSDKSSIRCIRQHIMEARKNLIETIGYERCMELGLCEMGEEVEILWNEDEEDLFHKVVYSNPVSLGRDFWKQLKAMFPSRTMKELVSYYFNVFMLRRRGTQNRFKTLDVDSDDDEWQIEYDNFYSAESLDEEDNNNGESSSHEEEEEETKSNNDEDEEGVKEESDIHSVYMDKVSRDNDGKEMNVEDDSCLSFELQDSNLIFSHKSLIENREFYRSGDDSYPFDDACDRRLASSDCRTKNNDLLPTSNIIKEIFGQDEWKDDDDDNDDK